jgi:putative Mg2+ transporter-C (MgtC) family protein
MLDSHDVWKLLLAVALGAAIGVEREFFRKPAGVRTNCLICLGAALFTILSLKLSAGRGDPGRIAAQIVAGVGFLGAGAILRDGGRVVGLTTAAGIWLVAAVGMAVGAGQYMVAGLTAAVALVVLRAFDVAESWIGRIGESRLYQVRVPDAEAFRQVDERFKNSGLRVERRKRMRSASGMTGVWSTSGHHARQEALVDQLLADPVVEELTW